MPGKSSVVSSVPSGAVVPPDPLEELEEAACLPTERLEAEVTRLAGHLAAAECRWLLLLAELDRREAWKAWGCASLVHWLGWHCGLDARSARERIRVARALSVLPAIREEFSAGRLSYSKVRAITRVAGPESEVRFVEQARHATAAQIERIVAGYRRAFDPRRRAEAQGRRRSVHWFHDDDGTAVVRAHLDPEDGALVRGVLESFTDRSIRTRPLEPGETRAMRRAAALVEMAEAATRAVDAADGSRSEASDSEPLPSADRHLVVVNVDHAVLAEGDGQRCELDGGPGLAADTARRLACDARTAPILRASDGTVLGIGVERRTVPRWLRRMLHARDRGCRYPGCGERRRVHAHHIEHWSRGGGTMLPNLVELCAFHHRLVHEHGWSIELDDATHADGPLVFVAPGGTRIGELGAGGSAEPPPDGHAIEHANRHRGITITADTVVPHWYGDHLDLDLALTALTPRA